MNNKRKKVCRTCRYWKREGAEKKACRNVFSPLYDEETTQGGYCPEYFKDRQKEENNEGNNI